tara:strand:- start:943 stop:1266 length:324 start_codon:yes stop_codon:yes gene_type:complete
MSYPSLWHNINKLSHDKSLSLKKKAYSLSLLNLQEQENKQKLPTHYKQQYIHKIPKVHIKEPLQFKKSYFQLLKYIICNLRIFNFYRNHDENSIYHLRKDITPLELL